MTIRYNPHRIEKQARKWPVSLYREKLEDDIKLRINMLWKTSEHAWIDPFACRYSVRNELQSEYGTDAVRFAQISAQQANCAEALLESSFKWLARLDYLMNTSEQAAFDPIPWLETALQTYDHATTRNNCYAGLALLRKALRLAQPGKNLEPRQRDLVISVVYPYAPLWAIFNLSSEFLFPKAVPDIVRSFSELVCVKFSLPEGGWHWRVFARENYEADPLAELLKIKWVKKAADGKIVRLESHENRLKICFA
ncbi:MAG: hypothetical protein CVV41_10915 [Candidatus Riflebacteria bacterium HGW-Riflebacteria-1]|nr:MAG: hypothetical protein CVV41_10915 [Candidatus Riflebacteria bacterium HGW-Riflebacteria-1]